VPSLPTIRRALLAIGVVGLVWALIVAWTGGFFWQIGPLRLSSRDPWRPLLLGIAAAVAGFALDVPASMRSLRRAWGWIPARRAWAWIRAGTTRLRRIRYPDPARVALAHVREYEVLNDRAGARSLMAQRRPGDAVMTTREGWPSGGTDPSRLTIAICPLLRQSLDRIGVTIGYHKFPGIGRLFVGDLEQRPDGPPSVQEIPDDTAAALPGCVAIEPVSRW
jgi:hypothetical protein